MNGDCGWFLYRNGAYVATFYLPETLTVEEAKALIIATGDFADDIEVRKAPNGTLDT